jgi:hypothetical protein
MKNKKYKARLNGRPEFTKDIDYSIMISENGNNYNKYSVRFIGKEFFHKSVIIRFVELIDTKGRVISYKSYFNNKMRLTSDNDLCIDFTSEITSD